MNEETKKPEEEKTKKETEQAKSQAAPAAEEKKEQEEKKEAGPQKKKKINRLTLKELEERIAEVQEKMGGLASSYAQQLLKRKEQLLEKSVISNQKSEQKERGEVSAGNS